MDGFRVFYTRMALYLMLSLTALLAGCSDNRDEILGLSVIDQPPPPVVALAPTVTAVAPLNNATGVAINIATISADFSEAVEFGDGASFVVTCEAPCTSPVGATVNMNSTNRVAAFTLPPATPLEPLTLYTGTIDGVTSIASGTEMSQPFLWSFTTAATSDTTRPRVTVTQPATTDPGPTLSVPANTAISAVFTEDMDPLSIDASSFTLTCVLPCVSPEGTVSYSVGSRTAVFNPDELLETGGTTYTATITTDATDLAGNTLAGNQASLPDASDYIWTFIPDAIDITEPTITLTYPANGDIDIELNSSVNATFDEDMDPTSISTASFTLEATASPGVLETGVVTYDVASKMATFNPSSNLAASTEYTATVTTAATDLADNPLGAGIVANPWSFTTGDGLAPGAITLGSASTFGIMATSEITSTGDSIINGDVSLDPGTSMTGFPPAIVNGEIHINDTVSAQARDDLLEAYNEAKGLACTTTVTAALGSMYVYPTGIPPGVYCSGSTMLVDVGAPIVLDAGGNANAVWVFQIGSSLTSNADVTLTGGAQAKNVFWVPTEDATIGSGTTFSGTIVSGRDVTAVTGATINGRILAGAITAGTIALQTAVINVPAP